MAQVSKIKLRPDVEERINKLLIEVLIGFKNKQDLSNFLNDFLSPVERTVLTKRLGIAALIEKGNSYDRIKQVLRVTPGTVAKMSLHMQYGNGSVKKIAEKIANSDSGKALLNELLSIFDIPAKGLPISEFHKKVQNRKRKIYSLEKEL